MAVPYIWFVCTSWRWCFLFLRFGMFHCRRQKRTENIGRLAKRKILMNVKRVTWLHSCVHMFAQRRIHSCSVRAGRECMKSSAAPAALAIVRPKMENSNVSLLTTAPHYAGAQHPVQSNNISLSHTFRWRFVVVWWLCAVFFFFVLLPLQYITILSQMPVPDAEAHKQIRIFIAYFDYYCLMFSLTKIRFHSMCAGSVGCFLALRFA